MQQPDRRLRPLELGDMLDEALALYRQNFALFAGIVAVLVIPESIITALINLARPTGTVSTTQNGVTTLHGNVLAGTVFITVAGWFISLIFGSIITGTLARAISHRYLGRSITIGQAYASIGIGTFVALFLASLLFAFAIFLGAFVVIVGAIVVAIRFAFVSPIIVLEQSGVFASFGRSRRLTKGSSWRVLGYGIVSIVILSVVEAIFGGIALAIFALVGGTAVITAVVTAVISIVVQPFQLGFLVLLYYDLRIRKEGFDLEQMASTMGAGSTI